MLGYIYARIVGVEDLEWGGVKREVVEIGGIVCWGASGTSARGLVHFVSSTLMECSFGTAVNVRP